MIDNIKRFVNEHHTLMVVIIGVLVIYLLYWFLCCKDIPLANKIEGGLTKCTITISGTTQPCYATVVSIMMLIPMEGCDYVDIKVGKASPNASYSFPYSECYHSNYQQRCAYFYVAFLIVWVDHTIADEDVENLIARTVISTLGDNGIEYIAVNNSNGEESKDMTGEIRQIKFNAVDIESFINCYCHTFSNLISSVVISVYNKNVLILSSFYEVHNNLIPDITAKETVSTTNLDDIILHQLKLNKMKISTLMNLT